MKVKNKANQKFNVHKAKSEIQRFLGQETKGLNKFPAKTKSRKQQRKEERQMKKAAKQAYYMKKSGKQAEAEADSDEDDEMPIEEISKPQKQNVKKNVRQAEPKKNEKKEAARVKEEKRNRQKEMRRANKDEDKVIKKMEKLLKLNKRKSKNIPKSFMDDGLDYLLEICDPENREKIVKEEVNFAQTEEGFEEDLALLSGKADTDDKPKTKKTEVLKKRGRRETVDEEEASDDFSEVDDEMDDGEEEGQDEEEGEEMEMEEGEGDFDEEGEEEEENLDEANEEFSGEEDEELDEEVEMDQDETQIEENEDEDEEDSKEEDKNSGKGEFWEDIYGRLRNKKGEIVSQSETGKYVPPAKRFSESKNADVERLERQLKGLLNRLAEQNLPSILSTVEELYLKNSRHTMNQVMTDLIFSSLVRHTLSPERLVMEHAVLIAALHANVGTEVGAQFIESTVRKFDEIYQSKARDEDSKNLDNLILIVSHLYNFKVIGSQLIFDILGNLTESFREKDIELILIIIRSVGFALRKDDPLSLKQVILNLQSKANAAEELRDQSRVRFMLDVLLAIRNNNIAKIPNYDPSHTEHLRKILRNTLTRKDATVTQLKISYRELLIAHSRGRWWVVGSAWAGEGPSSAANTTSESRPKDQQFSDELLELARKQRMNTDTRRNIFCIIMSSEDYVEASERLLGLGLQNQQEREIINVLVDCCLHEKKFNPYYAYLAQKLLNVDRKYQMAFQFCLWDRFKELGALKTPQIMNLAKMSSHVIAEQSLSLAVLKVIPFAEMDKVLVRFLRLFLLELFLHQSEQTIRTVFLRVASQPKFHLLREGLRLFMHHFLLTNIDKMDPSEAQTVRSAVEAAEQALNISAVKL